MDPKAGGKEKNSASSVNLTPAIKPFATQKATCSCSHGGRDSVVAVVTRYGLDGSAFEQALVSTQPSVQWVMVLFPGGEGRKRAGRGVEKLTGPQLLKKFPAFYETRGFITAFTSARQLALS